ncbi:hypothetical protein [Halomonas sp. 3D7M]|uniref:hypothetical protein n=1 Tax=Halomonas sp. 3D7M TaxID=2742617 RepID=UPI0018682992|nr:hypothetical protein [Halomonas sp. 3D7M]
MSDSEKEIRYVTFNGAGHTPLFFGVPLMLALSLMGSLIASFFIFVMILKWVLFGLCIMSVLLLFFVWAHLECAIETRAMEIRMLELRGALIKLLRGVKVIEVTSMKQTHKKEIENAERFIKRHSTK